ncbi:MAG: SGNH/GDSL hydrolase family protein [Planctomycetes bacterium]|nr:SGNH/GDSL hydrolase family protein [Planctomycetota bacterium]
MHRFGFIALAVAALLFYGYLRLTDAVIYRHVDLELSSLRWLLLSILVLIQGTLMTGFVTCVVRARGRIGSRRLWAATLTSALMFFTLEAAFLFVAQSHNVGYTLASRIWRQRYWQTNSLGYRDPEHVARADKKTVFLVGDSFAAGAGSARREDRFGDLLAALEPQFNVLNLGRSGADTVGEYHDLLAHPLTPDILVLQYYPNDIEGTATRGGWQLPKFTPYADLGPRVAFVVRNSFLMNFVYWQFPHADGLAYTRFLERAFADEGLLLQHIAELDQFCSYAKARSIPLVVVVFPVLMDLSESQKLTERIEALLADRGVPVVDVAGLVKDLEVGERTANRQDAHPSARVHALVAAALDRELRRL